MIVPVQHNSEWRFYRHDTPQGRWYNVLQQQADNLVDLGYAGSVTTILQALPMPLALVMYWGNMTSYNAGCEYRDMRAHQGTAIHIAIARLLRGEPVDTSVPLTWDGETESFEWTEDSRKMLMGFIRWAEENEPEPILIEAPVYYSSEDICFAGSVDLVASCKEVNKGKTTRGIIKAVDWKSSQQLYDSHFYQLMAYSKGLYHMGFLVDQMGPVRLYPWRGTPKYQEKIIDPEDYNHLFEVFSTAARLWQLTCDMPDFDAEPKTLPTQFSIKDLLPQKEAEKEAVNG